MEQSDTAKIKGGENINCNDSLENDGIDNNIFDEYSKCDNNECMLDENCSLSKDSISSNQDKCSTNAPEKTQHIRSNKSLLERAPLQFQVLLQLTTIIQRLEAPLTLFISILD